MTFEAVPEQEVGNLNGRLPWLSQAGELAYGLDKLVNLPHVPLQEIPDEDW